MTKSKEFWDNTFSKEKEKITTTVHTDDPVLKRALEHFGNIKNKTLIDLGCGLGASSLFFAKHGANVISIDLSTVAINNLQEYIQTNNIKNIKPIEMSALDITNIGEVDFVFGSMILHHIEPFHVFAQKLKATIKKGGKAFFWENNASSKTMIWFRQNIVGKLWIPKHGDPDEFPLTQEEIKKLRDHFQVQIEFPELLYFRLISIYILRGHLEKPFAYLDKVFYNNPKLRKKSYRQYILLTHK